MSSHHVIVLLQMLSRDQKQANYTVLSWLYFQILTKYCTFRSLLFHYEDWVIMFEEILSKNLLSCFCFLLLVK